MNFLGNLGTFLHFFIFCVRHTIDVLDPENQPISGSGSNFGDIYTPGPCHTDPHPPLRRMIQTCRDRLWPSLCKFRAQNTKKNSQLEGRSQSHHVKIILLSGGWGSALGCSGRLQVFYGIQGSGVVRHI